MQQKTLTTLILSLVVLLSSLPAWALDCKTSPTGYGRFIRGDVNGDKLVNAADALTLLLRLQRSGFPCDDAADVDNNERINLADFSYLLRYLYQNGPRPFYPFGTPGFDPYARWEGEVVGAAAQLLFSNNNYFAENNGFSIDLAQLNYRPGASAYFTTVILAPMSWPPANLPADFQGTPQQWENLLGSLPQARVYTLGNQTFTLKKAETVAVPFATTYWAVFLGNTDADAQAEAWLMRPETGRYPVSLSGEASVVRPPDADGEARTLAAGLYISEIAYFAEQNTFSINLDRSHYPDPQLYDTGYTPIEDPFFLKTVVVGYGQWPPANFDPQRQRSLSEWKAAVGELPGAVTYQLKSGPDVVEHLSSIPFTGDKGSGFWSVLLGDLDLDAGAEVWVVTSASRNPIRLAADLPSPAIATPQEITEEGLALFRGVRIAELAWFAETNNYSLNFNEIGFAPRLPAPQADTEAGIFLAGLYTAETAFFAELNTYSLNLNQPLNPLPQGDYSKWPIGYALSGEPTYYKTLVIGYGQSPLNNFDLNRDRNFADWQRDLGELPGAVTYQWQTDALKPVHTSSVPYTGTTQAGYWAAVIVGDANGADVWLGGSISPLPMKLDYGFAKAPLYFKTMIIGFGPNPLQNKFVPDLPVTLSEWEALLGKLPGAVTYKVQGSDFVVTRTSSTPFVGAKDQFWVAGLANTDADPFGNVWMLFNGNLSPAIFDYDFR